MTTKTWMEVRLLAPARMQEEASLFLTDYSGRGVIIEDDQKQAAVVIRAFFRPEEFGPYQQQELQEYLGRLAGYGLYPLGLEIREAREEDWAQAWKEHFKTLRVSPRLVIAPPWEEYQPGAGEMVVTIYPAMAFGTGRHPTTVLCLKALESVWEEARPTPAPPWPVLDVGTGSGILALAAARLGAKVVAIDVDPEAVAAALENVRLNALEDLVLVESTPLHAIREQFALIMANLTAPDLTQLAESLAGRLMAGGRLIISGFLTEDLPRLAARFAGYGLTETAHLTDEGWVALVLRRP
jgi:ribosomal protein L11 methyltransferase